MHEVKKIKYKIGDIVTSNFAKNKGFLIVEIKKDGTYKTIYLNDMLTFFKIHSKRDSIYDYIHHISESNIFGLITSI
jgi:hypothetical protein